VFACDDEKTRPPDLRAVFFLMALLFFIVFSERGLGRF